MRSFACALFGVLVVAASFAPARTWTNAEDQKLEADFVRYRSSDRTVLLRNEEGKLVPAPIDRLSEEDQQWVEAYREFAAPRIWGDPAKRQRGRYQVLRDDHVEVRLAKESLKIPLKDLTAEDVAHLEALYAHTEEELPPFFATIKHAAVASRPPDDAVERQWTDAKGRAITALYGGTEGDRAILWIKGKRYEYPLSRLSAADRTWVGEQKLGQLASDLQDGWSAASTIAMTGMAKAMMEGRTPPAMPPMGQPAINRGAPYGDPNADPNQMASGEFDQPPYDRGYQDPATDPNADLNAYQAAAPPADMPPPDETQPVDPNAAAPADPAASDNGRGPPPWISDISELSLNEFETRMREAFGEWVDNDEDPAGDAFCSQCSAEFNYPASFAAGSPCPFCGMAMAADDLSASEEGDDSDSSDRAWYESRFMRRFVIGSVVLIIGVGVQLARSGIFSGGGGGNDDDD